MDWLTCHANLAVKEPLEELVKQDGGSGGVAITLLPPLDNLPERGESISS